MVSKHLEPRQLPASALTPPSEQRGSSKSWLVMLASLAIAIGAGGTWLSASESADQVTQEEITAHQSAFAQTAPLAVAWVAADRMSSTLDDMKLSPSERARLQAALSVPIDKHGMRLASVTVWDTHEQDGDIVRISSAGYRIEVVLKNARQTLTFPVDGSSVVQITGVHDGGGGITLGVRGPNQEILVPIMSEGQALSLPIARD